MARRRRAARRRRSGFDLGRFRLPDVGQEVARSLVGITLLVLAAVTLIAFMPGEGSVTTWFRDTVGPWFGSLRWLLPFLLLATGWYIEWGPGKTPGSGWGLTLLGVVIAYCGLLGAASVVKPAAPPVGAGGGRVGTFLAEGPSTWFTSVGAFILLAGLGIAGVLIAFNLRLNQLTRPMTAIGRWLSSSAAASMRREPGATNGAGGRGNGATANGGSIRAGGRARGSRVVGGPADVAGQTGIWGEDSPAPMPSAVPTSATFAPARSSGAGSAATATAVDERPRPLRDPDDVTDASDSPPTRERREYTLPGLDLLDQTVEPAAPGGEEVIHRRTEEIIIKKLASFEIAAQIVGRNAGPVVTQYEVQPAPHVKVSRIEALADDLAMALAARTLRIEAPIPGKSAVGIEIPNQDFNVVTLRGILESLDFSTGSRLTFALGRDVAGRAQAVDLAKMPHLLIAGATGSGKSVMVNALITSLLCNASPEDLRMILREVQARFSEVSMWIAGSDLILIGTRQPQHLNFSRWVQLAHEDPSVARDNRHYFRANAPEGLLAYYVMSTDEVRKFATTDRRNSDDRPLLEFHAPRQLFRQTSDLNVEMLYEAKDGLFPVGADIPNVEAAYDAVIEPFLTMGRSNFANQAMGFLAEAESKQPGLLQLAMAEIDIDQGNLEDAQRELQEALKLMPPGGSLVGHRDHRIHRHAQRRNVPRHHDPAQTDGRAAVDR